MKPTILLLLGCLALSACSWFGGDGKHKQLSQREQWEELGYKDGLKTVKQGP